MVPSAISLSNFFQNPENSKVLWLSIVGGGVSVYWIYRSILKMVARSRLQQLVAKVNKGRLAAMRRVEEQISSATINTNITKLQFKELKDQLHSEQLSAVEVMQAYQKNALAAQRATNCVTMFIVEAIDEAKALDDKFKGKEKPALFGIPFSVKESLNLKGYLSTRGYAAALEQGPSSEDAVIVTILRQLGAIPIAQTNVPMSLFSYACSNPVYGKTTHPLDATRTPGGSSGGEAAFLALNGAPFGLGGDVGGSLRIPAHFCGISAIKPGHQRISQMGSMASVPGRPLINASVGPMANDPMVCIEIMKIYLDSDVMHQMDPYVVPMKDCSDQLASKTKLRIGYYEDDGWFTPTAACKRAVRDTVEKLTAAGHTLVPWTPHDAKLAMGLFLSAGIVDGGRYLLDLIENDLPEETLKPILFIYSTPIWFRRVLAKLISAFQPREAYMLSIITKTTSELRQRYEAIGQYRRDFMQRWREAQLDCVIGPGFTTAALQHMEAMKAPGTVSYTSLYNLLDLPVGAVPVTRVSGQDQRDDAATLNSKQGMEGQEKLVLKSSVNGSMGLPVGVQCIAAPHQEEMCMKLMQIVHRLSEFK